MTVLEGWLWEARRKAGAAREARSWRLAFVVPRPLLPPFEDVLIEAAEALLTTEIPPGALWRVEAHFEAPPDRDYWQERLDRVAEAEGLPPPELEITELPDIDWVAASLEELPPIRAGRLFVHGSHDRDRVPAGVHALEIEAGRAFGTGQHETTLGCLQALDGLARRHRFRRILDLGTGSGVLSLAAARLWRVPVVAGDIDSDAVGIARGNARANGLAGLTRFVEADGLQHRLLRRQAPYDLVLANILAGPLVDLAPHIRRATTADAIVVLSGLLAKQERRVLGPYRSLGFALRRWIRLGDWPTLVLSRGRSI